MHRRRLKAQRADPHLSDFNIKLAAELRHRRQIKRRRRPGRGCFRIFRKDGCQIENVGFDRTADHRHLPAMSLGERYIACDMQITRHNFQTVDEHRVRGVR